MWKSSRGKETFSKHYILETTRWESRLLNNQIQRKKISAGQSSWCGSCANLKVNEKLSRKVKNNLCTFTSVV